MALVVYFHTTSISHSCITSWWFECCSQQEPTLAFWPLCSYTVPDPLTVSCDAQCVLVFLSPAFMPNEVNLVFNRYCCLDLCWLLDVFNLKYPQPPDASSAVKNFLPRFCAEDGTTIPHCEDPLESCVKPRPPLSNSLTSPGQELRMLNLLNCV